MKKIVFLLIFSTLIMLISSCGDNSSANKNSGWGYGLDPETPYNRPYDILALLTDRTPVIKARNGQATIAKAEGTFPAYIDPNFKKWKLDKKSLATKETSVRIYYLNDDWSGFPQLYVYLNKDLDKLCLTQSQIIYFCKRYPFEMINQTYGWRGTFFLFKVHKEYFIAKVHKSGGGLDVSVIKFNDARYRYMPIYNFLFVVPMDTN